MVVNEHGVSTQIERKMKMSTIDTSKRPLWKVRFVNGKGEEETQTLRAKYFQVGNISGRVDFYGDKFFGGGVIAYYNNVVCVEMIDESKIMPEAKEEKIS